MLMRILYGIFALVLVVAPVVSAESSPKAGSLIAEKKSLPAPMLPAQEVKFVLSANPQDSEEAGVVIFNPMTYEMTLKYHGQEFCGTYDANSRQTRFFLNGEKKIFTLNFFRSRLLSLELRDLKNQIAQTLFFDQNGFLVRTAR